MANDEQQIQSTVAQPPGKGVATVFRSKRELMAANFLGGIAWGFGTVVGATIVVAILIMVLNALGTIPYIGDMIQDGITNSVSEGVNRAR